MTSSHADGKQRNAPFPGRKGDPRMNRAVEAREDDPKISLCSALLIGGFVFPEMESEPNHKKLRDTDGVTLWQRKNQLLRRLRATKGKDSSTVSTKVQKKRAHEPGPPLATKDDSNAMSPPRESTNEVDTEPFDVFALEDMAFDEVIYPQDEKREHFSLSEKEKVEIEGDLYGNTETSDTCFPVTANEIHEFADALDRIHISKKSALIQAQKLCPNILGNEHKEMFLRWADSNVEQAADRFVTYWNIRQQLFSTKAFLPLTLDIISDEVSFQAHSFSILPQKDVHGRALIWVDPGRLDFTKQKRESEIRYLWCIIHNMLEDKTVQEKGFIFLVYGKNAHVLKNFNRKYQMMIWSSINLYLPVKLKAIHFIRAPPFANLVLPIMKFFLGRKIRHRIRFHGGNSDEVLESLSTYGITPERLPREIGGSIETSICT